MSAFRLNVAGWSCQFVGTLFLLLDSIRVGIRLPREGVRLGDPTFVDKWYYHWASPIGFFLLLTGFGLCGVALWISAPRQLLIPEPPAAGTGEDAVSGPEGAGDVRGEARPSPSTTERLGLAEMQIVFDQMHARMNIVAQLMNFSVALAAAIITAAVTLDKLRDSAWAFLLFPLTFYLFAFLILREDFLLAAYDQYWYRLRYRVLKAGLATSEDLAFLPSIKRWKVGHVFTVLSGLRYVMPAAAAVACVLWALARLDPSQYRLQTAMATFDGAILVVLVGGVFLLGRLHSENEQDRLRLDRAAVESRATRAAG